MDTMVTIAGQALRCRVEGQAGAPWLVFSNSLMTDLSLWDDQVAAFGDRYQILRYDQRGHGGSAVPPGDCSFDQLVGDLGGLLAHFGITGAALVGVSMGGVTALATAARYADRVSRVAISDCQAVSSPANAAAWEGRFAVVREGGMAALVEPTISRWFAPATLQAGAPAVSRVRAMVQSTTQDGFFRSARALQSYDFSAELAALHCPIAFIAGAHDGVMPTSMGAMAATRPGAAFTIIPDAGHLPCIEQPVAFDAALTALLGQAKS